MYDEIMAIMIEKIAEIAQVDPDTLTPDTSFEDDLGVTSMELAGMVAAIEEEYDTYLEYTKLIHGDTIGEVAEIIVDIIEN